MADLSKMSDEELMQRAKAASAPKPKADLSAMSNEELMQRAAGVHEQPEPSIGQQVLGGVIAAGEFVDKYTGAPTRAAIGELIPSRPRMPAPKQVEGVPMGSEFLGTGVTAPPAFGGGSVVGAIEKFGEQFGEDPRTAPTGKELATRMGASEEESLRVPFTDFTFSPAGAAGLTLEILADPTNLIPFSAAGKVVSKTSAGIAKAGKTATKAAASTAAKSAKVSADIARKTPPVKIAENSAKKVADIVSGYVNPKQAANFERMKKTALKNGIDPKTLPDQVEFGAESSLGKLSRAQAEVDINNELSQKFIQSLQNTEQALENRIIKIGKVSRPPDALEAGNVILDGVQKTFNSLFGDFAVTYKQLTDAVPGLRLTDDASDNMVSKLESILSSAERRSRVASVGAEAAQARQVADNVFNILSLGDNIDDLVLKLHSIGNAGYVSKFARGVDIAPDEKAFREIYDVLKDAIIDSVRSADPAVADDLIETNARISKFLKAREPIENILTDGRKAPENIFKSLVTNGDSKRIEALKEVMPADDFAALKSTYLENLVKRNADGNVSFMQTSNKLANKVEQIRLSKMLSEQELTDVAEILELGRNHGNMVLNHSNTNVREFITNLFDGIKTTFLNEEILSAMRSRARKLGPPTPPAGLRPPSVPVAPLGPARPQGLMPPAPRSSGLARALGRLPVTTPIKPFQNREDRK